MLKFVGNFKELEKFGFKKRYTTYRKTCKDYYNTVYISVSGGKLGDCGFYFHGWQTNDVAQDTLYDLIRAGLVEKAGAE